MSRVLVTGATTPVGAAVTRELLDTPEIDEILAIGVESSPDHLPVGISGLRYHQLDLTRSRNRRQLLFGLARELEIDTVVHTALHRSARDTGRRMHALNVETTRELLHLSERHPSIRRFVYRSFAEIYRVASEQADWITEEHPVDLGPRMPQRIRDRIEADLTVCTRMGMSPLHIVVLRLAEILAPDSGSQLHDYLQSAVCLRPLGFDPMLNLLSVGDAARAVCLAVHTPAQGLFNIPGADTLPLSRVIELCQRRQIPVPGPLLSPLYGLRSLTIGSDFRYDLNRRRLHFSGVLDGTRAAQELGYRPEHPLRWPARGAVTSFRSAAART